MQKIFIALAVAFTVAGCAGLPGTGAIVNSQYNPITRERLYAAEASYNVAQRALLAYCGKHLIQCPRSKDRLWAASSKVNAAFVAARRCMRDTPNTVDCISGLENAVTVFRNDVARTGAIQ